MEAGIKMKFKDVGSFDFAQTIQKIANTPTAVNKASVIRRLVQAVQKARETISDRYVKDVMEVFGARDDKGNLKRPEGEPKGFIPVDGSENQIMEANEKFGENELVLQAEPLTASVISDIKLSAKELESLKDLFFDSPGEGSGPGLPPLR